MDLQQRALIVTLDIADVSERDWDSAKKRLKQNFIELQVGQFDELQVAQIASQLGLLEPDQSLLEQARQNIKFLEETTQQEIVRQVGVEFRACEGDSDGEWTAILMAAWAIGHDSSISKKALQRWIEALAAEPLNGVLAAFGLDPPSGDKAAKQLVDRFRNYRSFGKTGRS